MSRNRNGAYGRRSLNIEWGRKARKEEDRLRNLNKAASHEAVEEQLAEIEEDEAA